MFHAIILDFPIPNISHWFFNDIPVLFQVSIRVYFRYFQNVFKNNCHYVIMLEREWLIGEKSGKKWNGLSYLHPWKTVDKGDLDAFSASFLFFVAKLDKCIRLFRLHWFATNKQSRIKQNNAINYNHNHTYPL